MRWIPPLLAAWLLFAGPAPVRAESPLPPKCTEYGHAVRVCTQLDAGVLSRLGRTTRWRVWVEGEGAPDQIRLHNDSPQVVRLHGGDDQVVHTSCRRHRQVERKVTSLGPGEARLVARPYSAAPKQEAALIAASLAQVLARVEADFAARRTSLAGSAFSSPTVAQLVASTEAELLQALSYQELAALRAYVREKFRQARADLTELGGRTQAGGLPLPVSIRAVLASAGPLRQQTLDAGMTVSVLDRIAQLLRRFTVMAEKDQLVTSLCITSEPSGAKLLMRPQGIRKWTIEGSTTSDQPVLYRGLYAYHLSKGVKKKVCEDPLRDACAMINLVDDSALILHCDLATRVCDPRLGPVPGCRN